MLDDVTEFVSLAQDGAYPYGDRRVSRTERSKWRLTFHSLAKQAQSACKLVAHCLEELPGSYEFHSFAGSGQRPGLTQPGMVDKVTTVRRSRLGMRVGVLDDASVLRLNRALVVFLGIAGST